MDEEQPASPVRVGKTRPGEGNRKSLRSPKTVNGERIIRRVFSAEYKLSILAEYDRCRIRRERRAVAS